jgi:hypothetical protein
MATGVIQPPKPSDCGFAASITLKNGRVIYAADYNLRAFPIRRGPKKPKQ